MKFILSIIILMICPSVMAQTEITGIELSGKMLVDKDVPNLLPIGDSLTEGQWWTSYFAYRRRLQDLLGIYNYRFVGGKVGFGAPTTDLVYSRKHSGLSGDRASVMYTRLTTDLSTYFSNPQVSGSAILILIGTNDIRTAGYGTPEATVVSKIADIPLTTASMFGYINNFNPNLIVYVGMLPPCTQNAGDNALMESFNAALKVRLDSLRGTYQNLHYVDFYSQFTANPSYATEYLQDTVHPTLVGYNLMGDLWYSCMTNPTNQYCDGN